MLIELPAFLRYGNEAVILDVLVQEMEDEPLVDDRRPEADVVILAGTIQGEFIVVIGLDHGIGYAGQNTGQMLQLEVLRQGLYQFDYQRHFLTAVEAGLGMQAVVAGAAVIRRIVLPKVVEQQLATALAGFCVCHRFLEELLANLLLCHGLPLHELFQLLDILITVVGDAQALLTVASGTAGFLVIALDALGNIVMNHKTDVRFVYPHAKGDGGHNDVYFLHQELVLVFCAGFCIQAGVVRKGLDAIDGQHLGQFLHLFAAEAINDAGLAGVLADKTDNVLFRFHLIPYLIVQIGPVEG